MGEWALPVIVAVLLIGYGAVSARLQYLGGHRGDGVRRRRVCSSAAGRST